jgi:hypothetical protein
MTRIIGVAIILAGATLFVLGASPLLAFVVSLRDGTPAPTFGRIGIFMGIGGPMIVYGWHCVKGFKRK